MRGRLGQHFLNDEKILRQIADLLEINSSDVIIEIGPGHGELTKEFRIQNLECRIIAVEKDKELVHNLAKEFAKLPEESAGAGLRLTWRPALAPRAEIR